MKITYTEDDDEKTLEFINGEWSGEDPEMVGILNTNHHAVIGRHAYYPTPWHMVKAVAEALGGTLDTPEPEIPSEPGAIY